jgi:hypothetical protein
MINLGFLTEGNLAAIFITPSSWGSQLAGYLLHQPGSIKLFSGAVAEEEWKTSARGVFRTHILYFVLSFALLYFYLHRFISKIQKIRILGSCYFFSFSSSC